MAERLALRTSDHGVAGSNPAEGEILPKPKLRFIAQSLSRSPSDCLEMTEILLKGRKTVTHPSIYLASVAAQAICVLAGRRLPKTHFLMAWLILIEYKQSCSHNNRKFVPKKS